MRTACVRPFYFNDHVAPLMCLTLIAARVVVGGGSEVEWGHIKSAGAGGFALPLRPEPSPHLFFHPASGEHETLRWGLESLTITPEARTGSRSQLGEALLACPALVLGPRPRI